MPALALSARRLLPSQCEVCRDWNTQALCSACVTRFTAVQARCARCGLRLGVATANCGNCLREPPAFERTICVADYNFPWDVLVTAMKFQGRPELAATLAPLLAAAVRANGSTAVQRVLPIPMSADRLAERGYNQAWELARRVAAELRLPAHSHWLQRPVSTAHQIELSREARHRNLRAAFMFDPLQRAQIAGQHLALVDDVMTTGATAQEAAAVLRRAGAASVEIWVLARTPDRTQEH
jgi:ComF family protein